MKLPRNRYERVRAIMAYDEAAHAVVARKFGIKVLYIAMFPTNDETAAETKTLSAAYHVARNADVATTIVAYEKDIKVALAGPVAHHRVDQGTFKRVRNVSDADFVNAMSAAGHIAMLRIGQPISELAPGETMKLSEAHQKEAVATLKRLWVETAVLVDEHWPAIERVVAVLVVRNNLNPTQLDRIIGA